MEDGRAYNIHCRLTAEILLGRLNGTITDEEDDRLSELASEWWYLMNEGEKVLSNQWHSKHFPKPTPHPDTLRLEKLAKNFNHYYGAASGAECLLEWWQHVPGDVSPDDIRTYIDGLED